MGQVLHGSATTTEAVRRAIQLRQESARILARRFGVSPTTVQKWRGLQTRADARMGAKEISSTVLTAKEEAIVVAPSAATRSCRWTTASTACSPLDAAHPASRLNRSSLHRCLARHCISCLPGIGGDKAQKEGFANYPLGYVYIDLAEVST
jgi:hypothetical protein